MENEELVAWINAGIDTAEHMLALYSQMKGMIYAIARKYAGLAELEDLTQEGYIALCEAVSRYDPSAGAKFSSYAWKCIVCHMQRCAYQDRLLHIPDHMWALMGKYRKFCYAFRAYQGREPSEAETAYYLGLSKEQTARLLKTVGMVRMASLDSPVKEEDGESTIGDMVPGGDDTEGDAVERVQQEQLKEKLWGMVDTLPGQQPDIIKKRYQENMALQEIGDSLGLTREKVRQGECKALRAMRSPKISGELLPFVEEYISVHGYRKGTEWNSSTERTAMALFERVS